MIRKNELVRFTTYVTAHSNGDYCCVVRETNFRDLYGLIIRTLRPGIKRKTIIIARIRVSEIEYSSRASVVRERANRTIVLSLLVRHFLPFF